MSFQFTDEHNRALFQRWAALGLPGVRDSVAGGPVLARALRPLIDCAPPTGA